MISRETSRCSPLIQISTRGCALFNKSQETIRELGPPGKVNEVADLLLEGMQEVCNLLALWSLMVRRRMGLVISKQMVPAQHHLKIISVE